MAEASVDIVFRGKGLAGAERKTEALAKSVDKVDQKNKNLERTEKRSAETWTKGEKKKQIAVKKTEQQLKKLEAAQKRSEARRMKAQAGFSGLGKVGGAAGGFLGAVGEGIGTGGIGAVLGIAAAGGAVAIAALSASAARAAESITKTFTIRNKLTDSIKAQIDQNKARALAIGQTDAATALQLGAALTKEDFKTISEANAKLGIDGFMQAFNQAQKNGVLGRVGVAELAGLMARGKTQGISASGVVSNFASLSPVKQRAAINSGRGAQVGLGASSAEDLRLRESRIAGTSNPFLTSSKAFLNGKSKIQSASIRDFQTGSFRSIQSRELVGIVNAEAVARVALNRELQRELELKLEIARKSREGFAILAGLQETGSLIGLSESPTQAAVRAINDNMAGLRIQ